MKVLSFFVVDTHVTTDRPHIDMDELWPNLDEELKLQAAENMIDVLEIQGTYKLKDFDEKINSPPGNDSRSTSPASTREKRQIVAAIMAGIVTSLVSTFTSFQLFGMSQ